MADIKITVTNNLYSIELDQWDWSGLTVNDHGTQVTVKQVNQKWKYQQKSAGPLEFAATAAADTVTTVNPGQILILSGTGGIDHLLVLTYTAPSTPFKLTALCFNVLLGFPSTPSPLKFSQGKMTGEFKRG